MSKPRLSPEFIREQPKLTLKRVIHLSCFDEKPTYDKILGWVTRGFRGRYLEAKREGNHWLTTEGAVRRFLKAINPRIKVLD